MRFSYSVRQRRSGMLLCPVRKPVIDTVAAVCMLLAYARLFLMAVLD